MNPKLKTVMLKGILYNSNISIKFLFSLFIIFTSFLFFYVIGIVIVQLGFGTDIIHHPELLQDFSSPQTIQLLKFFQLIQSLGLFVIPPFLIAFLMYQSVKSFLRFNKVQSKYYVLLTIIAILSFIPFTNLLSYINSFLTLPDFMKNIEEWMRASEENASQLTVNFLKADNIVVLIYNIILIAAIPAIGEELLFRGLLQRLFTEWTKNIHLSIWLAAILFSTIHFQFFGFIPRLFLGLIFGYLLEYTGSIWIPIIGHFTNNLTGVIIGYYLPNENIVNNTHTNLSISAVIYGILGGLVGIFCFWLIIRKTNRVL
ncbi:MAG: CPBP family intramembrane metalloprotease [Bacteroidales bacterium]|nr:CPBP family intramembrane metalloprotease [Bacteroidales bacterium]